MLSPNYSETFAAQVRKGVRLSPGLSDPLPVSGLRRLETGLHERRLLHLPQAVLPLWFLAETEINVFLWRSSLSLIDKDRFDFWIDCQALVDKRLRQITADCSENPFSSNGSLSEEGEYLHAFLRLSLPVIPHVHALFMAAAHCLHESRSMVVLPVLNKKGG